MDTKATNRFVLYIVSFFEQEILIILPPPKGELSFKSSFFGSDDKIYR